MAGWLGREEGREGAGGVISPASCCRAAPIESLMKLISPHYKRVPPLK